MRKHLPHTPSIIRLRPETGQKGPVSFFWAQNLKKGGRAYVKKPAHFAQCELKLLIVEKDFFKDTARNRVINARICPETARACFLSFLICYYYLFIYLIEKKEKYINKWRKSENLTLRGIGLKVRGLVFLVVCSKGGISAHLAPNPRKSAHLFFPLNQCFKSIFGRVRGFARHFCLVPFFLSDLRLKTHE